MVGRVRMLAVGLAVVLTGCVGTVVSETFSEVGEEIHPGCVAAMEAAAAVEPMRDAVEDLDEAIEACPSLVVFETVSELFPDALDGADMLSFVRNRCAVNADLADSVVCSDAFP